MSAGSSLSRALSQDTDSAVCRSRQVTISVVGVTMSPSSSVMVVPDTQTATSSVASSDVGSPWTTTLASTGPFFCSSVSWSNQVALSSATVVDPVWSPGGALIYYLSERDGFRCVWARKLDSSNRRPLGEAFAVAHFHSARRSLKRIPGAGMIGLSVAPGRLILAFGELTGNIWLEERPR